MAIKIYLKIRLKYGDKAKSSQWMIANGHNNLVQYVYVKFGGWTIFKRRCGFNDFAPNEPWSKEKAVKKYQWIRSKYGDMASTITWMIKNGFEGLARYGSKKFGRWFNFKKSAGFDDKQLRHKHKCWNKKEAIEKYRKIRSKNIDRAKSSRWMEKNGYSDLVYYAKTYCKRWSNFKRLSGFNDPLQEYWNEEKLMRLYGYVRRRYGDKVNSSWWIMQHVSRSMVNYVNRKFGSWQKFLDYYNYSYSMSENDLRIGG